MKVARLIFIMVLVLEIQVVLAQKPELWNGKKCAVVLTYDDGLDGHLDIVMPSLDSAGFKGTFYIPGESPSIRTRLNDWRKAAQNGHELGNHTLTHPCDGQKPGRSWVTPDKDMTKYSYERLINEIRVTSTLLEAIDSKKERTFAFTCGDTVVEGKTFYPAIEKEFIAARGVESSFQNIKTIDLNNIDCFFIQNHSSKDMIDLVNKAMETRTLLVFLFHGVGGGHNINVSSGTHSELINYLKKHKSNIWVAPLVEVGKYIRTYNM